MKKTSFFGFQVFTLGLASVAISAISAHSATAATINLTFTKLSGLTGGTPQGTAVFRADLSDLGFDLSSITIADSNSASGGSGSEFSGFDLDGIKLSNTLITDASLINTLPSLSVFDFSPSGTIFTTGTQRPPVAPTLFGSSGGTIDNTIATLGDFDGNSTTGASAAGFASLGDGGKVGFNLTSLVSTTGLLYLYIGEVGDNGEVADGQITVSSNPISVPEPSSLAALSLMSIGLTALRRKKMNAV
ncbi:PEP-CTERM sorting domain-containing protein [Anabaena sp. UHCC 0399]|uniref:PEP-CTERM sorting domain-containing protein n=1 Tax=Anabaena sp. UHCC 0399 TaxID=3110238 RepID=UPI002B208C52|nr:PEP-CTERM sorting domain-containing protein [Anabaena sp. UHCC 0399]MEA5567945.1 PEP-CTERM sorting domain-containing protein [Anabaena sp. UHCC 0399]